MAAELGTAYRLPTLNELYFSGETPRGTVQGNSLLAPEETIGSQLTLSRQSDNLVFELSSFYNRVEDYIERVRTDNGSLTYQNLRSGRIWGFDGQLSIESTQRIKHRIAWQWQRGEADNGEFLNDLPPPEMSYTGSWRSGAVSVAVDLGYRFKRGDHGPGEIPLGSSLIGGARIAWNLNPHWSASLALSNGFDRIYRTSADEDAPLANERAAHLTLRWTP
jgi:iron complex outermembrane receptor protein